MRSLWTSALLVLCLASSLPAGEPLDPVTRSLAGGSNTRESGFTLTPPDPDDPLLINVVPNQAQPGQRVLIEGVNLGSAPQVSFNGTPASVLINRQDKAALVVEVPAGASPGSLVVLNTDTAETSNAAEFMVLSGTFSPACTISGTVRDDGIPAAPVANVVVAAIDMNTEGLVGLDVSDSSGHYSVGLAVLSSYYVVYVPPEGSDLVESYAIVECPGAADYEFSAGSLLSGRILSDQAPFDPIPNAHVVAEGDDDDDNSVTDSAGNFAIRLPDGIYDLTIMAPIGGRFISKRLDDIVVGGDTSIGEVYLDQGLLLSGRILARNGSAEGPAMGAEVALFPRQGRTRAIVDGSFFLAESLGLDLLLGVSDDDSDLSEEMLVWSIDLTSDMEMDVPIHLYTSDSQAPELPTIAGMDLRSGQIGEPLVLDAFRIRGAIVSVRFPDGMGGFVDADDTFVDPERALIVARIPSGAESGGVYLDVDGTNGPEYPFVVETEAFVPGDHTLSGVVSDDTSPVAGALVVLVTNDESEEISDYDETDNDGNYSVRCPNGNYELFVLPPADTGLVAMSYYPGYVTGDQVVNVNLSGGHTVGARFVDSGLGPVGATDSTIEGCGFWGEAMGSDVEEWAVSGVDGEADVTLPTGDYEFGIDPPFRSRYVPTEIADQAISADLDMGDVSLDSGYFIEGRVVDPMGNGLIDVDVEVYDWPFYTESSTIDETGSFRVAVPEGNYWVEFDLPDELDFFVYPVQSVQVWGDTTLYPEIQAVPAGHIRGTVYQEDGVTPAGDVPVVAIDTVTDLWHWGDSYGDGTYDKRVPEGSYILRALPSIPDTCFADIYYDGTYCEAEADVTSVTPPAIVSGIDFVLDPAGGISGRVNRGGESGDTLVCLDNDLDPCLSRCIWTDSNGDYEFSGLPVDDDYRVWTDDPNVCWDDHIDCTSYDPISLSQCMVTSGIDFFTSDFAGPVPDGKHVSGTQMTADFGQGMLTIRWQPTCSAVTHNIYFGNIGSFEPYFSNIYTSAQCNVGMTGFATMPAPAGDAFWVVVGDGRLYEGSYGHGGIDDAERPFANSSLCSILHPPSLENSCIP